MFDNIGKKIKGLAKAVTFIGILLSILLGMLYLVNSDVPSGILTIVLGCLGSWLGSLVLYGFGELVDCVQRIADSLEAPAQEGPVSHGGWTCPHCGEVNLLGDAVCRRCGK